MASVVVGLAPDCRLVGCRVHVSPIIERYDKNEAKRKGSRTSLSHHCENNLIHHKEENDALSMNPEDYIKDHENLIE